MERSRSCLKPSARWRRKPNRTVVVTADYIHARAAAAAEAAAAMTHRLIRQCRRILFVTAMSREHTSSHSVCPIEGRLGASEGGGGAIVASNGGDCMTERRAARARVSLTLVTSPCAHFVTAEARSTPLCLKPTECSCHLPIRIRLVRLPRKHLSFRPLTTSTYKPLPMLSDFARQTVPGCNISSRLGRSRSNRNENEAKGRMKIFA